tara:strand:- start:3658 stop:3771 length:114 start_codon:yes stop_codon:yes gene_type:complete
MAYALRPLIIKVALTPRKEILVRKNSDNKQVIRVGVG